MVRAGVVVVLHIKSGSVSCATSVMQKTIRPHIVGAIVATVIMVHSAIPCVWPTVVALIWEIKRVKRFLPAVVHATPAMVTVPVAVPANASASLAILQHVTANNVVPHVRFHAYTVSVKKWPVCRIACVNLIFSALHARIHAPETAVTAMVRVHTHRPVS